MSDNLNDIVKVQVTSQTASVEQKGFGISMILSAEAAAVFPERAREYTDADDAIADGFSASGATVSAIRKVFGQAKRPEKVIVGRRANLPTQVVVLTPVVANLGSYSVTINGTTYGPFIADSSATAAEIVAGLLALINADASQPVTASGTATLVLTSDVPGQLFTLSVDRRLLRQENTTIDPGVVADLSAIVSSDDGSDEWYNLVLDSKGKAEQVALMAAVEAMPKMFGFSTQDDAAITSANTDAIGACFVGNYKRSFGVYHPKAGEQHPEAGWIGALSPEAPGSENWNFTAVAGVDFTKLSSTEKAYLLAKNGNYYRRTAGQSFMTVGTAGSGEYIDITRLNDRAVSESQEGIFGDLIRNKKIPMDDKGGSMLEARVKQVLTSIAGDGGFVESSIKVVIPPADSISTNDKADRFFNTIKGYAQYTNAVNSVGLELTFSL